MSKSKYIICSECLETRIYPDEFSTTSPLICNLCLRSKYSGDFYFIDELFIPVIQGWLVVGIEFDWTTLANFVNTLFYTLILSFILGPSGAFISAMTWHLGQEFGQGIGAKWEIRKLYDPHGFDFIDLAAGILGGVSGIFLFELITYLFNTGGM